MSTAWTWLSRLSGRLWQEPVVTAALDACQNASGAIRYSPEPIDGVLGGGGEFMGHGEGADVAVGRALAVGADDAADESGAAGGQVKVGPPPFGAALQVSGVIALAATKDRGWSGRGASCRGDGRAAASHSVAGPRGRQATHTRSAALPWPV